MARHAAFNVVALVGCAFVTFLLTVGHIGSAIAIAVLYTALSKRCGEAVR